MHFIFPFKVCIAVQTSVRIMILTYLCRAAVMLKIFFFWYRLEGGGDVLLACGCGCHNPSAISGPLSRPNISPFSVFICTLSFSFRLLKSFFLSCHHYRYNIYCVFFTPLLCLFFYLYFLLTHSTAPVVPPHSIPKYDFSSAGPVV